MNLSNLDIGIFFGYVVALIAIAAWVSREKDHHDKNTKDYFLASGSLPWWAIGASLIAANISAEQIIGMTGSGYKIGLAIASYEWMAAITLLIVGKYCLPIFLKNNIYTMPQFLEQRFDSRVRITMAVFWLGVYVMVNLTAILWLGALAINSLTGVALPYAMLFLVLFSLAYSLYGGLKAVAYTDIIQVVLLVGGGLFLSYTVLNMIADDHGAVAGFTVLTERAADKFDMILASDHEFYSALPGLSVLLGGMWIMNISYWGFNQYIIQRALAAKSVSEAQKGIAFAAFLKLLMPLIVVLPGIAAVILLPNLQVADTAYPELMKLMPNGIRGLIFAALVAAIVSSMASMTNSIATIFTMDIYKHIKADKSQHHYVKIGRITSVLSLVIAALVAKPLLGQFDQAFQYIQEFTGFFTPGIVALFVLGMFYKATTANGALAAAIGSATLSYGFRAFFPELPFMDRVGIVFLLCIALAVIVSHIKPSDKHYQVELNDIQYTTSSSFNIASVAVTLILIGLYATWW